MRKFELGKKVKEKMDRDKDLLAVILFGSYVKGTRNRDIDICLVLKQKRYENLFLSNKRLEYLSILNEKFDVQIFQQLPLYIKIRVLREGKIIFCKNEDLLYEIVFQTIREFDDFRKYYNEYLQGVAYAR